MCEQINKITIEEIRRSKGNENLTEEEANEIIESLYQLSILSIELINKHG